MLHRTWACRVADIKLKKTLFPSLKIFFHYFSVNILFCFIVKKKIWVYDPCKLSKFFLFKHYSNFFAIRVVFFVILLNICNMWR